MTNAVVGAGGSNPATLTVTATYRYPWLISYIPAVMGLPRPLLLIGQTIMRHPMTPSSNSRGVTAVVVAIMVTVRVAMAAAAIDIGHALVARNELQNAAAIIAAV